MELHARGQTIAFDDRPLLMGIVNVTPDSFFDGGRYFDPQAAVAHAVRLVEEGADLLDIGAESTRPGAVPVEELEERRRLIPVVTAVAKAVSVPLSVDTSKAGVAKAAIDVGAIIVNDVTALRGDPAMVDLIALSGAGVVLMHMKADENKDWPCVAKRMNDGRSGTEQRFPLVAHLYRKPKHALPS